MIGNNDKETSDLKCGLSWLEGKTKILIQQNEDGNCKRVSHCPVVVSTSKKRQGGFMLAWCHRVILHILFFRKKGNINFLPKSVRRPSARASVRASVYAFF